MYNRKEILYHAYFQTRIISYQQTVIDRHLKLHECGNKYVNRGRWYRCTNSPVYKTIKCVNCAVSQKICKTCINDEYDSFGQCDLCDCLVGACLACYRGILPAIMQRREMKKFLADRDIKRCLTCDKLICPLHEGHEDECAETQGIIVKKKIKKESEIDNYEDLADYEDPDDDYVYEEEESSY